jgi:hypothetical protein
MSGLEKMLDEARQEGFKFGADFTKYEIDAAYKRGIEDTFKRMEERLNAPTDGDNPSSKV